MDEAVEAASLLDPVLPPSALLVDTLDTLAGVLADLELMPLALDYQRRAHEAATAAAADPGTLGPDDGDPDVLVATTRDPARRALRRARRGPARRRRPGIRHPAVRRGPPAGRAGAGAAAAGGSPASSPPRSCTAGRWSGSASTSPPTGQLRAAVRITSATADRAQLASAQLALGRALRRQADVRSADEHLVSALTLATEHGLPRLRRAALRELCTLHAELDDAGRALPYLQAYLSDELDRVDERRTRWVELFGRRKSLLETERAAGQLRRQAYEDPLTHLPNRRYAEARLDGLLSTGAAPALAVVDVDLFKSINDAIGHPGGDAVLRAVADLLVDGVRDTDEVCRWAGDEFVILLPDTTAEQARARPRAHPPQDGRLRLGRARPRRPGHDQRGHRLGRPRRRPPHPVRRRRRRALRRQAQRPRPRRPAVRRDPARGGRARSTRCSVPRPTATVAADPEAVETPRTTPGGCVADVQPPLDFAPLRRSSFAPLLVDPPLGRGSRPDAEPAARARCRARRRAARHVPRRPRLEPDVVWATGRTTEQVLALVREARREHPDRPVLVLRATADTLVALAAEHDAVHDHGRRGDGRRRRPAARAGRPGAGALRRWRRRPGRGRGGVRRPGDRHRGGPGGRRRRQPAARDADRPFAASSDVDCLVVVAGLDASLATTIGSMTDVPVVAVPTSTGRPARSAAWAR